MRTSAGVLALVLGYQLWVAATHPLGVLRQWGTDYVVYMEATRRVMAGGALYEPLQLLYPPPALAVLVPFSLLPPVAWWLVPASLIAYVAYRQCRTDWQRVALLAAFAVPGAITPIVSGNGTLWIMAAIAAANRWAWPGALILIKPPMAPWALIGIRTRGWWVALALVLIVSLALLPHWPQWAGAMLAWKEHPVWDTGSLYAHTGLEYLTEALKPVLVLLWFATRRHRQGARPTRPASASRRRGAAPGGRGWRGPSSC